MQRLKAASIVETIVAILLVFIAFGIGISIYLNVLRTDALVARSKAASILERIAMNAASEDRFIDETITEGDFRIEKKIEKYKFVGTGNQRAEDMFMMHLQVYDIQDQLVFERQSLIYYPK